MTKCLNPFLAPPDLTILSGEYCESGEAVFNIHKKTTLDKTMAFQQGEAPHNGLQVSSDNASCYQQSQEKEHPLEITRLPAHQKGSTTPMDVVSDMLTVMKIDSPTMNRRLRRLSGGGPMETDPACARSKESINYVLENILRVDMECTFTVEPDGSCFFHACTYHLLNSDDIRRAVLKRARNITDGYDLRAKVYEFLTTDQGLFQNPVFQTEITHLLTQISWEDYVDKAKENWYYADNLLITATSIFLGIPIHLYSHQNIPSAPFTDVSMGTLGGSPITLGYLPGGDEGGHFEPIRKKISLLRPPAKRRSSSMLADEGFHLPPRPNIPQTSHDKASHVKGSPLAGSYTNEGNSILEGQIVCKGCKKEVTLLISHLKRSKQNCDSFYDVPALEREQREVRLRQMRATSAKVKSKQRWREAKAKLRKERSQERREEDLRRDRESKTRTRQMTKDQWSMVAFSYDPNINYADHKLLRLGEMTVECHHCGAKKFKRMRYQGVETGGEALGFCCSNGKVSLNKLRPPPEPLKSLYEGNTKEAKQFLDNIRPYNTTFNMTSFGANVVKEIGTGSKRFYMPTFGVTGQIYRRYGSLLPPPDDHAKFLQLYFVGESTSEAEQRANLSSRTKMELILILQELLHTNHPYVQDFKYVLQHKLPPNFQVVIDETKKPGGIHPGRLNVPNCKEIAVIIQGGDLAGKRDIVLEKRNSELSRITDTHRSYDTLGYPIVFVRGEDGYHIAIPEVIPGTEPLQEHPKDMVSCREFYNYRFQIREPVSHLHRARALLSQFAVDMFVKMESERLLFIKNHQKELRADEYAHLKDALLSDDPNLGNSKQQKSNKKQPKQSRNEAGAVEGQKDKDKKDAKDYGMPKILPATHVGSPRYMHEKTQDGMKYVQTFGRPDLFVTFTCNPKWREIQENLLPGQKAEDRHDIVARVFKQKLTRMMDLFKKLQVFGPLNAYMYSIEWQKRGNPHAHILLWLKNKIHASDIDNIISAELPNPEEDEELYDIVKANMIHGPCGKDLNKDAPCMRNGKCSKQYPRPFRAETETGKDGYPAYRRRHPNDEGRHTTIKMAKGKVVTITNQWIVPYCPFLTKIFNAHINVEWCNSVKSIKYVCKYVNKGPDSAMFALMQEKNTRDEVDQFECGRYVSTNEAFWRFFKFDLHEHWPAVRTLSVHLENGQRVYFTQQSDVAQVVANPRETTLTGFFTLCQRDDFAKTLLYPQVPSYFTWDNRRWNPRKRGMEVENFPGYFKDEALGRVYTVHPNQHECFYLRLLLHEIRGPTSFNALKTVDGVLCGTYREACLRLGLLEDDAQWEGTLQDAAVCIPAHRMRALFAVMLKNCSTEISDPFRLWTMFEEDFCEDYRHMAGIVTGDRNLLFTDAMLIQGQIDLEDKVLDLGGDPLKTYDERFNPDRAVGPLLEPKELRKEKDYDINKLRDFTAENEEKLFPEQKTAYAAFLHAVDTGEGGLYFLDSPGGTGKTFLTNLLLAKVRQQSKIAVAVASSGIAAYNLEGGRTAHSTFKLPLDLAGNETPTCNIVKGSGAAEVLKQCSLIVWDECTAQHKAALEAVNRTLKDIRGKAELMGGLTVVMSGDFRQTLPVVKRGTAADEIKACLKSSDLWHHVKVFNLKTNMRAEVYGDATSKKFAKDLLDLGDGNSPTDTDGLVDMHSLSTVVSNLDELIDHVFPNFKERHKSRKWLSNRAILAPKNTTVDKINSKLLAKMPGEEKVYQSIDTLVDENEAVHYPTEFLNSQEAPGTPPHRLALKIGAPIILLRNLDPPMLCNGTRMVVTGLRPNLIEATIIAGKYQGTVVPIPRIPTIPNDLPFSFKRLQFPVRLAYAMTINKSQGNSLTQAYIFIFLYYSTFHTNFRTDFEGSWATSRGTMLLSRTTLRSSIPGWNSK